MADLGMFTRCPFCKTTFRISAEQLVKRSGKVRCGQCQQIFNAHLHLDQEAAGNFPKIDFLGKAGAPSIEYPASFKESRALPESVSMNQLPLSSALEINRNANLPASAAEKSFAELTAETTTVSEAAAYAVVTEVKTPVSSPPTEAANSSKNRMDREIEQLLVEPSWEHVITDDRLADSIATDADWSQRSSNFYWKTERQAGGMRWAWRLMNGGLAALLMLQAAYVGKDRLVQLLPATAAFWGQLCEIVEGRDCQVGLSAEATALSIEASELQQNSAQPGLMMLTTTVRNQSNHAVQYPYLALTLSDLGGQPQVRVVFAPQDYVPKQQKSVLLMGFAPGEEKVFRLPWKVELNDVVGYQLTHFMR